MLWIQELWNPEQRSRYRRIFLLRIEYPRLLKVSFVLSEVALHSLKVRARERLEMKMHYALSFFWSLGNNLIQLAAF